MSSVSSSLDSSLLETSLVALELSLGVVEQEGKDETTEKAEIITSRLDALETKYKSLTTASFNNIWDESNMLLEDLSPGVIAGTTYQQQAAATSKRGSNYPLIYRRQQVLASKESLQADMDRLSTILNLLLISQTITSKSSKTPITEEMVVNAPIVASTAQSVSLEEQQRLDALALQLDETRRNQVQAMVTRVDSLIQTYHVIIRSLSERIVALDEKLQAKNAAAAKE